MAELGSLFYNVRLRDMTDADIKAIADKLRNIGVSIDTSNLRKSVEDALTGQNAVKLHFDPQITSAEIENKLTNSFVRTQIKPITTGLAKTISEELKGQEVWIENLKVNSTKLSEAIRAGLQGHGFMSVADTIGTEVAKSLRSRIESGTYTVTATINIRKLSDSVLAGLAAAEKKEFKLRYDTKKFRSDLENAVKAGLKVAVDPQVKISEIENKLAGKAIKAEIVPLAAKLRAAIQDACRSNGPVEVQIGPKASLLQRLVTQVLNRQGYMVSINTVTGLESAIKKVTGTRYSVTLHADPAQIASGVQTALANVQSKTFGLQVAKDVLYNSIENALNGKRFNIQIQVMQDQARRAVQNALNNARMVGKDDALAYQRLQTGELKAAQAELARLKAAHMGAASAAGVHSRASINLGGALGSNIKLVGELGSAMAGLYSIHAAKQFLSQVVEIGGELEHQKIALETIYGSGSKMESLYSQIKGLARTSPFGVMDLTANIKQLSAYGVEYNEVYDTAKRLADISAATSVDISRLILAFGKTKNRTFLDGLEAKQFAYANIPIYDALSKKLTELEGKFVSVKDVMGRIKKREIGFDMVKEILWNMTDEGGKFYNMQEKLAGSVKTSWKLVADNMQLMFGEIAESSAGSVLKDLGVMMQNLTRDWKTLSAVVVTGASAFGLHRLAVMASNATLGKATGAALKKAASQRAVTEVNAKAAMSYRFLTDAEAQELNVARASSKLSGFRIFNRRKLTILETEALMASKNLTREQLMQLVAMRKVSAQTARQILLTSNLTNTERQLILAEIQKAEATKRSSVIFGQMRAAGSSLLASLRALMFNPFSLIMAGLTAAITLWSRNNEEMEKTEEISKNLFSKAVDGAKDLSNTLEGLKPSGELSELELTQGIERLENAIKDFSPTPIEDINSAFIAQDGHINTLTQRYDTLKSKAQELHNAYESLSDSNISGAIEGALKATDGGNWFTQLFDDNLETNGKDYTNALKRRADNVAKYTSKHLESVKKTVDGIAAQDKAFADSIANMANYEQKLSALIDFGNGKYTEVLVGDERLASIGNTGQIQAAYNEMLADTDKFVADLSSRLRGMGWNLELMTPEQKTQLQVALKSILEQMEGAGQQAKAIMAKSLEGAFDVPLMEDKITLVMIEQFKAAANASSDAAVWEMEKTLIYEGYDKLSPEMKEMAEKMMAEAGDKAKEILGVKSDEWQSYLSSHPLTQTINLIYHNLKSEQPTGLLHELIRKRGLGPNLTEGVNRKITEWTKLNSVTEARNTAAEQWREAKKDYDEALKAGLQVKQAKATLDEIEASLAYAGWEDLQNRKSGQSDRSGSKSQKDLFADEIKERMKLLKDALKEYEDFAKKVGKGDSMNEISKLPIFAGLKGSKLGLPDMDVPQNISQYKESLNQLEELLEQKGLGTKQRRELKVEIEKVKFDLRKQEVDNAIKEALDAVNRDVEKQTADWNLFDRVWKATGNKNLAVSLAFGMNSDAVTDYPQMIKSQFEKTAKALGKKVSFDSLDYKSAYALGDKIGKAWENAVKSLADYARQQKDLVADILKTYQSTADKVAAIKEDTRRKIEAVNNDPNLSSGSKEVLTRRIQNQSDFNIFKQSTDYLQFFNAIYSLTLEKANQIGVAIRENLDKSLRDGTISADDYAKEIERIDGQIKKIIQKKNDFQAALTGGLEGLANNRYEQALSDFNAANDKKAEWQAKWDEAKAQGNQAGMDEAQAQMDAADSQAAAAQTAKQGAQSMMMTVSMIDTIIHGIDGTIQGITEAFHSIADMMDSFGVDTQDGTWATVGAALDSLSALSAGATKAWDAAKKGDIGGVISGAVQSITAPITIWNKWHDNKYKKDIEKSKRQFTELDNMIAAMERRMERFLGNTRELRVVDAERDMRELNRLQAKAGSIKSKGKLNFIDLAQLQSFRKQMEKLQPRVKAYEEGGALGYERQLMVEQLAELERQKADMEAMKKKDPEAIADITDQIDEQRQAIRDFAEEMASVTYGIELSDWASQIGNSLVDAFAKGEDAAEAFDKTASSILRSLVSKMIEMDIIAPMFEDLRDYLFGSDGMSGAYGNDFKLDASEVSAMKSYLDKIKDEGIPAAEKLFDAINEATGGMLNDTEAADSPVRAGIQSVTENTADLLASYINAIRADVSTEVNVWWPKLLNEALPQFSAIAEAQTAQLRLIAENTRRNMLAAEAIQVSNQRLVDLFIRAQQSKDNGFYIR